MSVIRKELTRNLPVKMSSDDRDQEVEKLVAALENIADAEAKRAMNNATLADIKKKNKAVVDACIESLSSNTYQAEVECEERWDYEAATVTVVRLDTEEELSSREMIKEEVNVWRQRDLDLPDGATAEGMEADPNEPGESEPVETGGDPGEDEEPEEQSAA